MRGGSSPNKQESIHSMDTVLFAVPEGRPALQNQRMPQNERIQAETGKPLQMQVFGPLLIPPAGSYKTMFVYIIHKKYKSIRRKPL